MAYVDGFLLPVPKKNLALYRRMSARAGRVWRKCGALEYRECVGDDLKAKGAVTFPKATKTRAGETVVFSWIVYRSRAHRDTVVKKVMADPGIQKMMTEKAPFDYRRMAYGGFRVIVDL